MNVVQLVALCSHSQRNRGQDILHALQIAARIIAQFHRMVHTTLQGQLEFLIKWIIHQHHFKPAIVTSHQFATPTSFLAGGKIVVRRAGENEKITTLDDVERQLNDKMLVIADAEKAVAIAGVMGGENSEINDNTKTIVFESANFNGPSVRLTAKAIGLRTEASGRYEKGLDPEDHREDHDH